MIIDTHVWIGDWPFGASYRINGRQLVRQLRTAGIDHAVVSPLGALLAADPANSNNSLIAECRQSSNLFAAPILNPTLGDWREHLAAWAGDSVVGAIKLCPAYHNYHLDHPSVAHAIEAISRTDKLLIIHSRMIDERHRYFGLNLQGIPVLELQRFLQLNPDLHPLLLGIYRDELKVLGPTCSNFSMDIAMCEWLHTIEWLNRFIPSSRLVFGSNTPLLVTAAVKEKIYSSDLTAEEVAGIESGNAIRLLGASG